MMGTEATLLGVQMGSKEMQRHPQKSKNLKGTLKAGGLVFAFWLEVCMETCDKGTRD